MVKLTSRQIGRCGELFVQYKLLKYGVDSSNLTVDVGIDLVAYSSIGGKPLRIQVKTSSPHSDRAGEKYLRWQIPESCPADYIAAVDFENDKFWLIRTEGFRQLARHRADGELDLRVSLPGGESTRVKLKEAQIKEYEMDIAIPEVFGPELKNEPFLH